MRRPLIALLILIVALAIGYGIRAARSDSSDAPQVTPSVTATMQHT